MEFDIEFVHQAGESHTQFVDRVQSMGHDAYIAVKVEEGLTPERAQEYWDALTWAKEMEVRTANREPLSDEELRKLMLGE